MKASPPAPELPGIGRRLAGMLYESLLLIGVLAIILPPLVLLGALFETTMPIPVLRVYLFLGIAAYFIWHWHAGRQTLAMKTWKLQLATSDGGTPTLGQLALRYVLAWPSIGLGGIGIAWALWDRHGQFLHDRLAGTRIVFRP
jgi:uncharacterized RDD family membrane protein YckC